MPLLDLMVSLGRTIDIAPEIEARIPNIELTKIALWKFFIINFAAAAGVISILKTSIIPTDCNAPITAKDNTTKNKLSYSLVFKPVT